MTQVDRIKYLRIALRLVGLIFVFGVYPLAALAGVAYRWLGGEKQN